MKREVVDDFRNGKYELLALTETKGKEEREKGTGVYEIDMGRESVAVLLSDVWYRAVI